MIRVNPDSGLEQDTGHAFRKMSLRPSDEAATIMRMNSCQNVFAFSWFPDNLEEVRAEAENVIEKGKKAPRKEPGDRFPIAGGLIGLIAGFIIGIIIGGFAGMFIQAIGAVCGGIIGTLIGSLIRFLITIIHRRKNNLRYYQ
jgi:uncharacterized protein YcfJ